MSFTTLSYQNIQYLITSCLYCIFTLSKWELLFGPMPERFYGQPGNPSMITQYLLLN